jgi:hypothetical protein
MNTVLLSHLLLASQAPDPDEVKPGGLALVIVLLMCAVTFLLWRSMNRQLRKVDFDEGPSGEGAEPADGDATAAEAERGEDPEGRRA